MNQEQIRKKLSTWWLGILVMGMVLGWFANDIFGGHYALFALGDRFVFRINTRTGATWGWQGDCWSQISENTTLPKPPAPLDPNRPMNADELFKELNEKKKSN